MKTPHSFICSRCRGEISGTLDSENTFGHNTDVCTDCASRECANRTRAGASHKRCTDCVKYKVTDAMLAKLGPPPFSPIV